MARLKRHLPNIRIDALCITDRCHEIKPERMISPGWGHGPFPPGPWQEEPDRVDFKHNGLYCMVHRNGSGAWCGYVAVSRSNPAFGHHYDDISVSVHGGLTFADRCGGHLCHMGPSKALWWVGFDCSHFMDLSPVLEAARLTVSSFRQLHPDGFLGMHYRDLGYVMKETHQLAAQVSGLSRSDVKFTRSFDGKFRASGYKALPKTIRRLGNAVSILVREATAR